MKKGEVNGGFVFILLFFNFFDWLTRNYVGLENRILGVRVMVSVVDWELKWA